MVLLHHTTALRDLHDARLGRLLGLGNDLARRRQDDLDVAWVTLVGVDTTVGSVCAAAGFLWEGE